MPAVYEPEMETLNELETEFESEFEGELESEFENEFENEFELEGEGEFELESELEFENPVRKVYADAMMEHLGHMASESETEQEAAEHFLPLIGLAAKKLLPVIARAVGPSIKRALPHMAKAITRVEPRLTQGVTRIAKVLHRNQAMRPLLRTVPHIARSTVNSIARQAAHGRPVSASSALRTLANRARHVLLHPHHRRHVMRRSTVLDNHLHRRIAPGVARPHWRHYRGAAGRIPGVSVPGAPPVRWGGVYAGPGATPKYGGCTCAGGTAVQPNYCRCCGQIIR